MRLGLTGSGATVDDVVDRVARAEEDGFTSLWFTSAGLADPLIGIAVAGRATSRIELGTAVLQTYPCHPALLAARAAATASAIGTAGRCTIGVGPSHKPIVEGMLGLPYTRPGRHTEEYLQVLAALLRGEPVTFAGEQIQANLGPRAIAGGVGVSTLVAGLGPRLLRVAGEHSDGTVTWMANARAIESHVAPRIRKAAADAGRPAPRIVAGLPVAVHDDAAEARDAASRQFRLYESLPNYQRILDRGGLGGPADAAIVGNEATVTGQLQALFDAGATDVWAAPFAVGEDRSASRARTHALLKELATR